ncbi:MAG: Panacea domain-containing protein [Candidatus Kaiserbacteria bacterium]|nr:Panacea domain-containing protein [Candidatus Kaiserbacteria bacterium]
MKAVKLIALADVYALRHYGSTLSSDTYYAMKNGPVASNIDNIIEQSDEYLGDLDRIQYVKEFLEREPGNTWSRVRAGQEADSDYLSERDTEVLDMIFEKYYDCSPRHIIEKTHQYQAWKKHESALQEAGSGRVEMEEEDFFENDGDLAAPKEVLSLSREFYGRV